MRILLLSTSMGMGGADQQLLSAALGLRRRGHEVRIVSLTPLGEMGARARAAGLPTESLEMRRGIPGRDERHEGGAPGGFQAGEGGGDAAHAVRT